MARHLFLVLALVTLTAGPALAQNEPVDPDPDEETPELRYAKKTEIDFDVRHVDAAMVKPYGALVGGLPEREKTPLLTLRADFNEEMKESVDSVR